MHRWIRAALVAPAFTLALAAASDGSMKAQALVQEAVAFGKANGLDRLLREINLDQGRFHAKTPSEVYLVVYDGAGKVAAHGLDARHLRMDHLTYPELKAMADKTPKGWHEYTVPDPMGRNPSVFGVAYARLGDDLVTSTVRVP